MRMKSPKPCPACGGNQLFIVTAPYGKRKYHIECICHFAISSTRTKWGAIRKWNRMKREVRDADIF